MTLGGAAGRRALRACLALPLAGIAAAAPAGVPEIVARSIEHHGGELYRGSETELTLCSGSGCYDVAARVEGGLYELQVSGPTREGRRTVRMSNDALAASLDGRPLETSPERAQALRDWAMARVYFAFLPFRLADPSVRHRDLGVEVWNGRRLHKVVVGFAPGSSTDASDEYLYWFDPASGRLEQFAYSFAGEPGGLRFRRLTNYRRVGGILFFDQENLGVEGEGLEVGRITPEFVRDRMRAVSTVTLSEIRVRRLDGG